MAKKRFTDIEIWDKEWFMDLTPKLKCLIRYLFDNCDAAGVWSPNWRLASLHIGEEVSMKDLSQIPASQYEVFGEKIFLPDFINFQYGSLSETSPAHKPVFAAIKKHGLGDRAFNRVAATLQEKDKDIEKEMEKDEESDKAKETKGGVGGNFLVQKMFSLFKAKNKNYPGSVDHDYKPLYSIANFLCEQGQANGPPEANTERILEVWEPISDWISKDSWYSQKPLSTIRNGMQEITQKLLHGDKSTTKKNGPPGINVDSLKRKAAERTGNGR